MDFILFGKNKEFLVGSRKKDNGSFLPIKFSSLQYRSKTPKIFQHSQF